MKKLQPETSMKIYEFLLNLHIWLSSTLRYFCFSFLGKLLSGKQSIDYEQFGQWQLMVFQGFILFGYWQWV